MDMLIKSVKYNMALGAEGEEAVAYWYLCFILAARVFI